MLTVIKKRALRYARAAGVPGTLRARDVFQDGSEKDRRAFYNLAVARNREGYAARVGFMEQLNRDAAAGNGAAGDGIRLPELPRDKGHLLVRPEGFPLLDEAIEEARGHFRSYTPGTGTSKRERDPLQGVPREDRSYKTAINRLAMHPEILRVVSNYIGYLPLLMRINLLYSPNDEVIESSSQFFHLDPEDVIMTKLFVFVEDVDADTGPTRVLPADRSALVRREINYRKGRIEDDVVARIGGAEHFVDCTGPAGTLAFLDTCRCFHLGSRVATKPRSVIMVQYMTPYAANFEPDGPLPAVAVGPTAIPPDPTPLQEYLFGLKR